MTDSTAGISADLLEDWSRMSRASDPAHADPVALDCARRLAGDPSGDDAVLRVFGLVNMADYVVSCPDGPVETAVLKALSSAARTLDTHTCDHRRHRYEQDLAEWETDDTSLDVGILTGFDSWDEEETCPRNAAGWARLAIDVIRPGHTSGIPVIVPDTHRDDARELERVLNDHPDGDPLWTLEQWSYAPRYPTRASLASFALIVNASCWYAGSDRIKQRSILDDMIDGCDDALRDLPDASCGHTDDEHETLDHGTDEQARIGIELLSPGGRAGLHSAHQREGGPSLEVLTCPVLLRRLVEEARDHLSDALEVNYGHWDVSDLDKVLVRADGRLDIGRLVDTVRPFRSDDEAERALLWSARRYACLEADAAVGPEGVALLLLVCEGAASVDMPYAVGRDVLAVLRDAADVLPLGECEHPDGHAPLGEDGELFAAHLGHLYAPGEYPAPAGSDGALRGCPQHLAAAVRHGIAEIEDLFEGQLEDEEYDE